jgi:hypothetical protein
VAHFDRAKGRFFDDRAEADNINRGLDAWVQGWGTAIDWWAFVGTTPIGTVADEPFAERSVFNDLYDEGSTTVGSGKKFRLLPNVPVLSASVVQGEESANDMPESSFDSLVVRASNEQLRRAGVSTDLVTTRDTDVFDRIVFRNKVWDIRSIRVEGHISTLDDFLVTIRANEMRDDELQDSPQFGRYSTPDYNQPSGPYNSVYALTF